MRLVPLALLGCLLLHLLCGCGRTTPPTVGLVSMRFETATALETTMVFTVRLSNENAEPVALTGQVHRFHLNGLYVGKGMSDAVQTPAKAVERSIETTKSLLARATVAVGEATKSLYETSTKVTGKSVDKAGELAQKWVRKKNKEQGGPSAPSPNGEV